MLLDLNKLELCVYTFQSCNTRWLTDPLDVFWSLILGTLQIRVPSSCLSRTLPRHSQACLEACKLLRYIEHLRMYLPGPLIQLSLETKTYMERHPLTSKL